MRNDNRAGERSALARHLVILCVPILVLGASVCLLYRDFTLEEAPTSSEPALAQVRVASGDVKRKPDARMVWYNLRASQDVFRRDSVRTSDDSTATIVFPDGSTIEVGENSLIVLEKSKDRVSIDFKTGNLLTKGASKNLTVRSQGVSIETGGAEIALASHGGSASVSVRSGEAKIESGGKSVTIAQNQQSEITQKGVGAVQEIPFALVSPARNELILVDDAMTLATFQWKSLQSGGESGKNFQDAKVEVSTDSDFRKVVKSISLRGRAELTAHLEAGRYYWRVSGEKGALSDAEPFELARKEPIRLLDPAPDTVLRFARAAPRPVFRWLGPAYLDSYVLEIASDPGFKTIIHSEKAEGTSEAAVALDFNGNVYWRVRGSSERLARAPANVNSTGADSPGRVLALKKLDHVEPPELLEPKPGDAIVAGSAAGVTFRWAALDDSMEYLVEVSDSQDFKNILDSAKTTGSSHRWNMGKTSKLGRLYWRVSAVDADKQLVPARQSRDFLVLSSAPLKLVEPAARSAFAYVTDKPEITLKWEEDADARSYEVEIARDFSFNEIAEHQSVTKSGFRPTTLADGAYFWRVRALDGAGRPYRTSAAQDFSLHVKDLAAAPELLSPAAAYVHSALKPEDSALAFSWKEVPGVSQYELEVTSDSGGEALKARFTKTQGELKKLAPGTYRWSVRGLDSYGRLGQSGAPRTLIVKQDEVLAPPVLHEAAFAPLKLSWDAVTQAGGYSLEILQNGAVVAKKESDSTSLERELKPGKYEFRVRTKDVADRYGPWSTGKAFSVLPEVPVPVAVHGPVALRLSGTRQTLSWTDSKDASAYAVRVYKGDELVAEKSLDRQALEFDVPGPGKYSFEVAAVSADVQSAFSARSNFEALQFKLEKPILVFPTGNFTLPDDRKVELEWKEVKGAESYEIRLLRKAGWNADVHVKEEQKTRVVHQATTGSSVHLGWNTDVKVETDASMARGPASDQGAETSETYHTSKTSMIVNIPTAGNYVWEVKAEGGPPASGEFQLIQPLSPAKIDGN